jgi:hypothetical protein
MADVGPRRAIPIASPGAAEVPLIADGDVAPPKIPIFLDDALNYLLLIDSHEGFCAELPPAQKVLQLNGYMCKANDGANSPCNSRTRDLKPAPIFPAAH